MKYIFIWLTLNCFHMVHSVSMYRSCKDVLNDRGTNATDGEYDIYLENKIGVKIYCHDFSSGQPKEFLTLKAERSSNFASYYDNVGSTEACADLFPQQNYSMRGRTEFTKLRLNTRLLVVDTDDFTFTKQIGPNKISYGRGGDKFSSSPLCEPMGTFSIDLSGTPFSLVPDTKWAWVGNYTRGNVIDGHATVKNETYLGCWQNGPRAFRGPTHYDNTGMTQQTCVKKCRGYGIKLAGLQSGSICYCPLNYDTIGPVSEASCDKPCAGDPNQICGGETTVSVYDTDVGQKFQGRCGGYPGYCFPTTSVNPKVERLQLRIADGHKCFDSPCYHEGKCVAVGSTGYQCRCYPSYGGHNCLLLDEIILDDANATCPSGSLPEGCECQQYSCPEAKFENNKCVTRSGYSSRLTCRPGDSGHSVLTDIYGPFPLRCPRNSVMVNCAVSKNFDPPKTYKSYGQGYTTDNECDSDCESCRGQVRCKHTICNCGAHGHCNLITGQCECDLGYYGETCDVFDYCSYYEDLNNVTACTNGGICRAVYKNTVKAYAGDKAGDTCIFPFDYKGLTYNSCVEDDTTGPPFACSGLFRKTSGYIDLGKWSPGSKYTVAAWVRPAGVDTIRRTVVGGVQDCNDFGFNLNSGTFRGFLKLSKECTRDLDAGKPMISIGQWYMVAITNNATHAVIYQNGEYRDSNTVLMNHFPTTQGFRIGGEVCCPTDYFNGMIRTVKVWKRALSREEINRSMYNIGTSNSTTEALHDGLVGHWELADSSLPPCLGIDHGGSDWNIQDGQLLSGIHCNISRLFVPKGVTAIIQPYNGTAGGKVDITAKTILIDGIITGTGAGYRGGPSNSLPGEGGNQGESYLGLGETATSPNRGGGGGGEAYNPDSSYHARTLWAGSGAGGGYMFKGGQQSEGSLGYGCTYNTGTSGEVYGDNDLSTLFLGSGGGSGGNALDLSSNPKGGKGGNGGGAIKLTAETSITVNGGIFVDGEAGEGDLITTLTKYQQRPRFYCPKACNLTGCKGDSNTSCWDISGSGGGGSGGSIHLSAKYVSIGNRLSARGGIGGKGGLLFCGGNGGFGRIRIDSVVFSGRLSLANGIVVKKNLTTLFFDHSQGGQKLIDPLHTRYGNEIYWGCFKQSPGLRNTLGYAVPLTTHIRRLMTPDYCMFRCREKGYSYSGTQNGQECYCDNHLLVEFKVHDSECNTSCDGDALQMCGGDARLQVFGPPPSSPAPGYGVLSKCEPWCVTADPNTQNPKWGLCSAHKPVITDWNIQCECPAGKTGNLCDELCPRWTYGRACKNNCTCNETNTAYCEPNSGACQCKPGFQGLDCSPICTEGFFGQGCESPCNCSNNAVCDPQSGVCRCRPGWTGADCQFPCPKNKFGIDCNQTCNCNQGSCAPEHGQCQCDPGYKLPFCYERCDPDTYGQDCEIPCDCNGQYCDSVTGLCQCFPGYIGNKCEIMCPHGTYGQGCLKPCPCQNGFGCDHQTGQCHCGRGFIGENCELQCPYGSYGSDCLQTCPCNKNQTSTCSVIDGECFCLPGFVGDNCEFRCTLGYYGEKCKKRCDCLHSARCEATTGSCICAPGFIGKRCEVPCPDGSYGSQCQSNCPTCNTGICSKVDGQCICKPNPTGETCLTCPQGFSGPNCTTPDTCVNTQLPRNATGSCVCSGGWMGPNCDQPCPPGRYGSNCLGLCNCFNGTCHREIGICFCNEGFTGKKCNTPCKSGQYGRGCRFQCQRCGAHALPGCDIVTGNCLCSDGYTGPMCDRPCPQGTYGKNCSLLCSCYNGGLCDSVTGKCICKAGFTGKQCDQRCSAGSWGVGCNQTCNCGPHGVGCSPDEGMCICKAGFTGVKCRETCPVGTYGKNCTKPCHCDPYHGRCSPIDGSCLCDSGWTGSYCEQVCDRGFWGRGCTQKCQCNGRGTCNPFNGVCDCDVGYIGPACDQQCKQGIYWGDNCANKCDCGGGHCDHRTGKCTCPAGKIGHNCEKGCDSNYFGFLCAQVCGCQNNAKCDTITGFCACQPGWSGVFCTEPCPEGYYGVDCAQPCPLCLNGGECDTFTGLCNCPAGFTGPVCNTSAPGVVSSLTGKQTSSVDQTGVVFTTGQLAGLIIGFVIIVVLAVIITVIFMRKKYVGRFGSQSGAMQFQEEVEIKETQRPKSADVAATSTGFINPLNRNHEFDENFPDSRSEVSESTSGVASNVVESDDEDKNYFKDSAA